MANINDVSKAYANTLKQGAGMDPRAAAADAGPSFGDVLKSSLQSAVTAQHKSEQVSAQAVIGKANMTDVLQAVTEAEVALNTVLAVRDRVVQAYQEIMRTPI
jgi:flagellar hook-basal body complex protein FliE